MLQKDNLILVHSFPTNSIILSGLIDYLNDFFNVYFIDLPGFTNTQVLNTDKVNLNYYSSYLSQKILDLNLESYIVGGISFGFVVVNNASLDVSKCKAILALEPYINYKYLNVTLLQRTFYSGLINLIELLNFTNWLWQSPIGEKIIGFALGHSYNLKIVLQEINPKVFFSITRALLNYNESVTFKKGIPYVLWINQEDHTISAQPIISVFEKGADPVLVKFNEIEHYPKDLSKEYFASKLSAEDIKSTIGWINSLR